MSGYEELRRKAEAATRGEWRVQILGQQEADLSCKGTFMGLSGGSGCPNMLDEQDAAQWEANASYIVATSPDVILALLDDNAKLKAIIGHCQWYWPADDTSSEACSENPREVAEYADPGTLVEYSRGGIVETGFYGYLPAADDADSDDDFEVDEPTEQAATAKMEAEVARRSALTTPEQGE